jgi:hypothetical protein
MNCCNRTVLLRLVQPANKLTSKPFPQRNYHDLYTTAEDRTRSLRSALSATLQAFESRQETELVKIPRELRLMTIAQLESVWGGSWGETIAGIRMEAIKKREREEEGKREKVEEEIKGKRWVYSHYTRFLAVLNPMNRKRGTGITSDSQSPDRTVKNGMSRGTLNSLCNVAHLDVQLDGMYRSHRPVKRP